MDKKIFILVVDDDPSARLLMKKTLEQKGFTVIEAENGRKAIAVFETLRPDLVLLDVNMPEMDGFEACRRLRAHPGGAAVPVMIITSTDASEDIRRAYDAGATDFMSKPISSLILKERVSYMLRACATARQLYQSKELLAKAQAVASMGSFLFEPNGANIHVSDTFRTIFRLADANETVTWNLIWRKIHSDDRAALAHKLQKLQISGDGFQQDVRLVDPAQGDRFAMLQIEAETDKNGKAARFIGMVQDITERKRQELLERDKNQVMQRIVKKESLTKVFLEITRLLERQRPYSRAAICQVEDGRIQTMFSPSLPAQFCKSMAGSALTTENGTCAAAAYLGKPVVAENTASSPFWKRYRDLVTTHGILSSVSAPIISGAGQVLGTVALMHHHIYEDAPADFELMKNVANLAALAAEQHHLSEQLNYQARHDYLTGLANRATLAHWLSQTLKQYARNPSLGAYLLIDIDRFKHINDSHGHYTGDRLLQEVSKRLQQCVRKGDVLSRVGGDEFVLVLSKLKHKQDAVRAAARILESFHQPFMIESFKGKVEASIGISLFPQDGMEGDVLHKNADVAMYIAKNQGGNRFQFFDSKMHEGIIQRLQIENDLRKALERNEFELHYQPQLDLTSKKLMVMEALIRWNHPEHGQIPPAQFIPVAEESRLIIPIGGWVLKEACRQNAEWQKNGFPPVRVAVNVSAVQFTETNFVESIQEALEETGLDPKWLEVEITETVVMKDLDKARRDLQNIQKLGVTTTLDDFGSGHSSITYLDQMPLDGIKIDRHFIGSINIVNALEKTKSHNFVKAFANLAQDLEINLVAEGIETEHQREILKTLGYTIGQGFLFSAPLASADAGDFLNSIV
ncbi:MAG: EAL domain-containing protein [Desulfosalsimonadaceae bacterium]